MKTFNISVIASVLMAGLLACTSASAAIIEVTSRAAFNAATTGQTVEPNSAPPGQLVNVSSKTINGITYPDYAYMIDPAYAPGEYEFLTGPVLVLADESNLSFGPVFAFAADFATTRPPGGPVTITIDGIYFVLPTSAVFELTFYGFISTTPFTSVSLVTEAEFIILDNVTLANAAAGPAPVPEPASIALLGLGLAALAWRRRRH